MEECTVRVSVQIYQKGGMAGNLRLEEEATIPPLSLDGLAEMLKRLHDLLESIIRGGDKQPVGRR